MTRTFLLLFALAGTASSWEWTTFNGKEYYISKYSYHTSLSWHEARAWCNRRGAELASILTENERDQIVAWSNASQFTGGLWHGLNQLQDRQNWKWSNGDTVGTTFWAKWYPVGENWRGTFRLCGYQMAKALNGAWHNAHCDDPKGFICKRNPGDTDPKYPTPQPIIESFCPEGYIGPVRNKCFKIVQRNSETGIVYTHAVQECRKGPGRLPDIVSINDQLEQAYLTMQLQNVTDGLWIGLTRPNYFVNWRWSDNSPNSYQNWGKGEPQDNWNTCAEIWIFPGLPGTWNNIGCGTKRGYICQTLLDADNVIPTPAPTTPSNCPAGYTPYWQGCYKLNETPLSWQSAEEACQSEGGHLASIMAETENAAVHFMAFTKRLRVWIGLHDTPGQDEGTGMYTWVDDWHVLYTKWGWNEPLRVSAGGCVEMKLNGEWQDWRCDEPLSSICKITYVDPLTTPSHAEGFCPDQGHSTAETEWETYGDYCYYFETTVSNGEDWAGAQEACFKKSPLSRLVSIHSLVENEWIFKHLGSRYPYTAAWIGMYRTKKERSFAWDDQSPVLYTHWVPGEPNGNLTNEECVEMYTHGYAGKWNDQECHERRGYVCKSPKAPPVTIPPELPGTCPNERWVPHGSVCHLFQPDLWVTWDTALGLCKTEGGDKATLVSLHSSDESVYIHDVMIEHSNRPTHRNYWIGLYKTPESDENNFKWLDGSSIDFTQWALNEPNYLTVKDNCVEVYTDISEWNDCDCTLSRGFVCVIDKVIEIEARAEGLSGGAIAGAVIGSIVGLLIVIALVLYVSSYFGSSASDSISKTIFSFTNPLSSSNAERMKEEEPETSEQKDNATIA